MGQIASTPDGNSRRPAGQRSRTISCTPVDSINLSKVTSVLPSHERNFPLTINVVKSKEILYAIDEELDRLRKIRNLLCGAPADGRWNASARGAQAKKRVLSQESRQRIVDAQKRRWAARTSTS